MMRYIKSLENKDLALNTSMISLGSCTMKLNAATEDDTIKLESLEQNASLCTFRSNAGLSQIINELSDYLCKITVFDACSLQPTVVRKVSMQVC
jgi:glycine dehydrogenase